MRKYYDYCCDTENDEDTIANSNLIKLYDICFKYCESFSVIFFTSLNPENAWDDCEKMNYFSEFSSLATKIMNTKEWPGHRGKHEAVLMILPCNEQTRKLLETVTTNIRDFVGCWGVNNPEDIAFYRSDGSAMFYSTIHACIFHINADDNEDISEVLSILKWNECEQWYHDKKRWF